MSRAAAVAWLDEEDFHHRSCENQIPGVHVLPSTGTWQDGQQHLLPVLLKHDSMSLDIADHC